MSIGQLTRYALPYSNVVPAGTATNQITPGRTLETYRLELGGTALTKAMLTLIRVKANGKTIVDTTGAELDKVLAYRGQAADVGFLDVPFMDDTGLAELDRMRGALDTSQGIVSLTTEIAITGATAPTLKAIQFESARQLTAGGASLPFAGEIAKLLRYPFSIANGGQLPVNLPFGPRVGSVIKRLHFFHTGNLTGMLVKQDGLVMFEATKAENEFQQKRWGRVPQANVFTVDFMLDGNTLKALDTRDDKPLEVMPTFSAADNGVVLVEYLDPLGNL